jgi:hypothetical protein
MSDIEVNAIDTFGDVIQEEDLYTDSNLITNEDCIDCD